jgi:hypothetical protein
MGILRLFYLATQLLQHCRQISFALGNYEKSVCLSTTLQRRPGTVPKIPNLSTRSRYPLKFMISLSLWLRGRDSFTNFHVAGWATLRIVMQMIARDDSHKAPVRNWILIVQLVFCQFIERSRLTFPLVLHLCFTSTSNWKLRHYGSVTFEFCYQKLLKMPPTTQFVFYCISKYSLSSNLQYSNKAIFI